MQNYATRGKLAHGSGPPSDIIGINGDFYIDTLSHILYGPKENDRYSHQFNLIGGKGTPGIQGIDGKPGTDGKQGSDGPPGSDGTQLYYGTDSPPPNISEGGFYFQVNNVNGVNEVIVYGPKYEDNLPVFAITPGPIGEQGEKGAKGQTGPQGQTGDTGPPGPQGESNYEQGIQGPPGDRGERGKKGESGPKGEDNDIPGIPGIPGLSFLSGEDDPHDDIGNIGDYYLNLTTNILFGPKEYEFDSWNKFTSIVGPSNFLNCCSPSYILSLESETTFDELEIVSGLSMPQNGKIIQMNSGLSISQNGKYRLMFNSLNVYISEDYGFTWNSVIVNYDLSDQSPDILSVDIKQTSEGLFAYLITSEYIYVSIDNGHTFNPSLSINMFPDNDDYFTLIKMIPIAGINNYNRSYIISTRNGIYRVIYPNNIITQLSKDMSFDVFAVTNDMQYIYANNGPYIYVYDNNHDQPAFESLTNGFDIASSRTGQYLLTNKYNQDDYILYTASSSDYGQSFVSTNIQYKANNYRIVVSGTGQYQFISSSNDNRGNISTSHKIYMSINYGKSWCQKLQLNESGNISLALSDDGQYLLIAIGNKLYNYALYQEINNSIIPTINGVYDIGSLNYRINNIYLSEGVVNLSDRNKKKDIADSDLGLDFIKQLRPVKYTLNNEQRYGFIAQEIESVLMRNNIYDFAGIEKEGDNYGLIYTELLSPLIKANQEMMVMIDELEQEIENLEK